MLLLDSEAISCLAHGPALRRDRVRALIVEMRRRELPVATVAAVLAEVVRGRPRDAAVFSGLRRERVESASCLPCSASVSELGQLLGGAGFESDKAVDAFVVAVADLTGGAVVATVDNADVELLSAHATSVQVALI